MMFVGVEEDKTDDVAIRDATGSLQVEAVLINRIPLLPLKFESLFHVTDIAKYKGRTR